ncbi:NADPH-dependent FMN reductase [Aquabacterium sp.]|uniref:NADPH-dependent FMN reductase n=1 Tax=Aquabacterium sp. TaxID=1872578 RepID=UPI002CE03590|nr:NADPH-dependent FMN reductase [Aquabacterium sp.]HSW04195.1 NADPH-dependent FMN reductase [Aquabacterium sp.]
MHVVSLSGSPSASSRSAWLLHQAAERVGARADSFHPIDLRRLPAEALLAGDARHPALRAAIEPVLAADLLLVATPIYKAAYSGLLKVFIDLLPADALRHTTVLPLATGGSPGHLLALDYALKPVLSALGARHILDAVYGLDAQLPRHADGHYTLADELAQRLDRALAGLFEPTRRAVAVPC